MPGDSESKSKQQYLMLANSAAATTTQILVTAVIDSELFLQEQITADLLTNLTNGLLTVLFREMLMECKLPPVNVPLALKILAKQLLGRELTKAEKEYERIPHEIDFKREVLNGLAYSRSWLLATKFSNSLQNIWMNELWSHLPWVAASFAVKILGPGLLRDAIAYGFTKFKLTKRQQELLNPWCDAIANLLMELKPRVEVTEDGRVNYQYANRQGSMESFTADNTVITLFNKHAAVTKEGLTSHFTVPDGARKIDILQFKLTMDQTGQLRLAGIGNDAPLQPQLLLADRPHDATVMQMPMAYESALQLATNILPSALIMSQMPSAAARSAFALLVMSNIAFGKNVKGSSEEKLTLRQLNKMLENSVRAGQLSKALYAVEHGADPDLVCDDGVPVLSWAVVSNLPKLMEVLIAKGAAVNKPDVRGHTPIYHAISTSDRLHCAEILLKAKVDPNQHAANEEPLLISTVEASRVDAALLLLKYGADPNAISKKGESVAGIAARLGLPEVIDALINVNADLNIFDKEEYSPLHTAFAEGNTECAIRLLKSGKVSQQEKDALLVSSLGNSDARIRRALILLEYGANPNAVGDDGYGALIRACASEDSFVVVESLVKLGAVVNALQGGATPLYVAAKKGTLRTVTFLLEHGADPDLASGYSPLAMAVFRGHYEVAEALLNNTQHNANVNALPAVGYTVVDIAPDGYAIFVATEYVEQVQQYHSDLLSHGAKGVNYRGGLTPLEIAASLGLLDFTKLLLAHGANPNYGYRRSAVVPALMGRHEDVALELLNNGADFFYPIMPDDGSSVLDYAKKYDFPKVVSLLEKKIAEDDVQNGPRRRWIKGLGFVAVLIPTWFGLRRWLMPKLEASDRLPVTLVSSLAEQLDALIKPFVNKRWIIFAKGNTVECHLQLSEDTITFVFAGIFKRYSQGFARITITPQQLLVVFHEFLQTIGIGAELTLNSDERVVKLKLRPNLTLEDVEQLSKRINDILGQMVEKFVAQSPELAARQQKQRDGAERLERLRRFQALQTNYNSCISVVKTVESCENDLVATIDDANKRLAEIELEIIGVEVEPKKNPNIDDALAFKQCIPMVAEIEKQYEAANRELGYLREQLAKPKSSEAVSVMYKSLLEAQELQKELHIRVVHLNEQIRTDRVCQKLIAPNTDENTQFTEEEQQVLKALQSSFTAEKDVTFSNMHSKRGPLGEQQQQLNTSLQRYKATMGKLRIANQRLQDELDRIETSNQAKTRAEQATAEKVKQDAAEKERKHEEFMKARKQAAEEKAAAARRQKGAAGSGKATATAGSGFAVPAAATAAAAGSPAPVVASGIPRRDFTVDELLSFFRPNVEEINNEALKIRGILSSIDEGHGMAADLQRHSDALYGRFIRCFELMTDWKETGRNAGSRIHILAQNIRDIFMHARDVLTNDILQQFAQHFCGEGGLFESIGMIGNVFEQEKKGAIGYMQRAVEFPDKKIKVEQQLQELHNFLLRQPAVANRSQHLTERLPLNVYRQQIEKLWQDLRNSMAGKRIQDIEGFSSPDFESRYAWGSIVISIGERVELVHRYYSAEYTKWQKSGGDTDLLTQFEEARARVGHYRFTGETFYMNFLFEADLLQDWLRRVQSIEHIFPVAQAAGAGAGAGAAGAGAGLAESPHSLHQRRRGNEEGEGSRPAGKQFSYK
jgi:ankyrin repeat protein